MINEQTTTYISFIKADCDLPDVTVWDAEYADITYLLTQCSLSKSTFY